LANTNLYLDLQWLLIRLYDQMEDFDTGLLVSQRVLKILQSGQETEGKGLWTIFILQETCSCLFKAGRIMEANQVIQQLSAEIPLVSAYPNDIYRLLARQANILRNFMKHRKDYDQLDYLTKCFNRMKSDS
jgi:hypothetical protein